MYNVYIEMHHCFTFLCIFQTEGAQESTGKSHLAGCLQADLHHPAPMVRLGQMMMRCLESGQTTPRGSTASFVLAHDLIGLKINLQSKYIHVRVSSLPSSAARFLSGQPHHNVSLAGFPVAIGHCLQSIEHAITWDGPPPRKSDNPTFIEIPY